MEIIRKMINNEMPLLPDLYMPICDVRMVARAHMQAMLLNEAQNLKKSQTVLCIQSLFIFRK